MGDSLNCQICGINKSKYSCPKCHIGYCSVSCYQSNDHLQCSELFYKQWVQEELNNGHSDPQDKKRMLAVLKENQETNDEESLDSDDEEAVQDLASRMMDVNLDDEEAVWERLTVEEKHEFRKLVASGNIMKILPEWEPWWKTRKRKTLIIDTSENCDWKSECPAVPSDIPRLSKLTSVDPSPYVPYMLLNVLLSYVFTVRWFRGAHYTLALESISACIALSATLRSGEVFKNIIESFMAFEKDLSQCKWVKKASDIDTVQEDLVDIIHGSNGEDLFFCVKAVICDLNVLASHALDILAKGETHYLKRFSGPPPKISLLRQVSRKMLYYLSWTVDHGSYLLNIFDLYANRQCVQDV